MLGTFIAYWGLASLKLPIGLVFVLAAAIVGGVAGPRGTNRHPADPGGSKASWSPPPGSPPC